MVHAVVGQPGECRPVPACAGELGANSRLGDRACAVPLLGPFVLRFADVA
jgi:hypothetical protein